MITFAALALFSSMLSGTTGTILTATAPGEICDMLEDITPIGQTIIFVDIDETLIREGSDVKSWEQYGNFSSMKVINGPLLTTLTRLTNQPSIKTVALTSACAWVLHASENVPSDSSPVHFSLDLLPNSYLFSCNPDQVKWEPFKPRLICRIRSEAMATLVPAFQNSFGPDAYILAPMLDYTPQTCDKIIAKFPSKAFWPALEFPWVPLELGPTLQTRFPDLHIYRYTYRLGGKIRHDYYVQDSDNNEQYRQIIAWPIYTHGVIFGNPFTDDGGMQKGLVMWSFLETMVDEDQWPTTIIAIDDNLDMLQNILEVCNERGITFIGIHYHSPPARIFNAHS
jgi:hypothetical protein